MMKFDAIIIGGGHSGLARGIELLGSGRTCIVFSRGEGARRFRDPEYSHAAHRREFERMGGVYVGGDIVREGVFGEDGGLLCIRTENQGDTAFCADEYYLASGSFFSGGLVALEDSVIEPVFGLEVDYEGTHCDWVDPDFYADQPFMHFGVRTDRDGHPFKDGKTVGNLYAIGSIKGDGKRQ